MSASLDAEPPAWFAELIDGFFGYLRRRGRRAGTFYVYGIMLRDFARWIDAAGVHQLGDLRRQHIEAWQDGLAARGMAPRSQHVAGSALKGCLRWSAAAELEGSSASLWMHITLPSLPAFEPKPLEPKDLRRIEEYALAEPEEGDVDGFRRRALFWLLLSSGSRITAVLELQRTAIKGDTVDVIQKGGRRHTLVLSELAVSAINAYLERRTDTSDALFVGTYGGRLGRSNANLDLARLARAAGIPRFNAHRLRHTCATVMRRNGGDLALVAKHLGHRGLQTVQGYTGIELDERRAAVAGFSPAMRF